MRPTWVKAHRGAAGIIAALIMFAMLMTSGLYFFFGISSSTQLYQQQADKNLQDSQVQSAETLSVTPRINSTLNQKLVTVANTGPVTATVVEILIQYDNGTIMQLSNYETVPGLPLSINPGDTVDVYTYVPGQISDIFSAKVLTDRGKMYAGSYPPTSLLDQLAYPRLAFSFGTLQARYSGYMVMAADQSDDPKRDPKKYITVGDSGWRTPLLQWEVVQASYWFQEKTKEHAGFNTTIWLRGSFINLQSYDVYLKTGTLLLQVGFGGDQKRVYFLGGTMTGGVVIRAGQVANAVFEITQFDDAFRFSEKNMKSTVAPDFPWLLTGTATFAGTEYSGNMTDANVFKVQDKTFETGAILLDGVEIYGIGMLTPSELGVDKTTDTFPARVTTTITATAYKPTAAVAFTLSYSGNGCGAGCTIGVSFGKSTLHPSASGQGPADSTSVTFTVPSNAEVKQYVITITLTSTTTVTKSDGTTKQTIVITDQMLIDVVQSST